MAQTITPETTVVLLTGGNQGIGFATVKKLASENPSYHVLLGARSMSKAEDAVAKIGLPNVSPLEINIVDDASIAAAAAAIDARFGRLDVLINNAGISSYSLPSDVGQRVHYRTLLETNVTSQVMVTEAMVPLLEKGAEGGDDAVMAARGPRRLVFLSSSLGSSTVRAGEYPPEKFASSVGFHAYRCTKAALNMVMLGYAHDFKEKGWKVNACCPGYISTNLNKFDRYAEQPEMGAITPTILATLGQDGETGTYINRRGKLPW